MNGTLLGPEGEARKTLAFQMYSSFFPNSLRFSLLGMHQDFCSNTVITLFQVSELKVS